jgi:hypothetical protein
MDVRALFGLSVPMSFIAFGIVTKLYIWPQLGVVRPEDALTALVVHTFRFAGLSFLVPGVVSDSLPFAFAASADLLCVGRSRSASRNLPGPDSASHWSRVTGRGIFHSDGCCTTIINCTRTNILAAPAVEALDRHGR